MNMTQDILGYENAPPQSDLMMLFCSEGGAAHEEYLTIEELAERLSVKPKTIRNKMASGIFKRGTHYYSPNGLGPRFQWSAVKAWLESEKAAKADVAEDASDGIPMARGYVLGPNAAQWNEDCTLKSATTGGDRKKWHARSK